MVINFNEGRGGGSITITGITSTLNLSTASAEEIMAACQDMDKFVFLANYGGKTYVEEMRNDAYQIYFYVTELPISGVTAMRFQIRESLMSATLHPDTGEVTFDIGTDVDEFAPNIVYTLNSMRPNQLLRLRDRIRADYEHAPATSSFLVRWFYNNHDFIWTGNYTRTITTWKGLEGRSIGIDYSGDTPKVILATDFVFINDSGEIQHRNTNTFELSATPILTN